MFGIDSAELLIIALVALVVVGPKDLPRLMRTVGNWVGQARGMAKHFRSGLDAMMREAELEEMEKLWKANNDKIMREHPADGPAPAQAVVPEAAWAEPVPALENGEASSAPPPAAPVKPKAAKPKPPPRKRAARPVPAGPAAPPRDEAS
jgi:sec-independent protein translocase protein TatB